MASVVFIIRVPYEESSKDMKPKLPEEGNENLEETKGEGGNTGSVNDQNVKEVKFDIDQKTDNPQDQNEAEIGDATNEADYTTDDVETLTFISPLNLAEVLQNELRSLNVQGDSWTITNDKQFHQVTFLERTGERVDKILERLTRHVGVGKRPKSSVSIIPTSVHIQPQKNKNDAQRTDLESQTSCISESSDTKPLLNADTIEEEMSPKEQFKKSIKSRLTVEQVVECLKYKTNLTFDFVTFTVIASLIAAVGLAEDNAVVISAGILFSPLQGPILGVVFGAVIKNKSLRNTGLKTGLCGLILSVFVGFLFGFICGPFGRTDASWDSRKGLWPTNEMTSRGMTRGLWVGVCIALPSGAGVALSVLGSNTGFLVGVAISASLLPPAVNSGMLWAYSIITAIKPPELDNKELNNFTSNCQPFKDNSYMPIYSCDMGTEAAIMAVMSLVVTVVNMVCILITATIVLKIKEVTPKASSSNATQEFWTQDIKVAREAYETVKGGNAENILKEWKKVQRQSRQTETGSRDSFLDDVELLNLVEEVERAEEFESVVRRAPRGAHNLKKFSRDLKRLVSKESASGDYTATENQLRNLHACYTQHPQQQKHQPHVSTIFSEQEAEPESEPEPKPQPEAKKGVREFHVIEIERPHLSSVVRVQAPTEESNTYSVRTESGV